MHFALSDPFCTMLQYALVYNSFTEHWYLMDNALVQDSKLRLLKVVAKSKKAMPVVAKVGNDVANIMKELIEKIESVHAQDELEQVRSTLYKMVDQVTREAKLKSSVLYIQRWYRVHRARKQKLEREAYRRVRNQTLVMCSKKEPTCMETIISRDICFSAEISPQDSMQHFKHYTHPKIPNSNSILRTSIMDTGLHPCSSDCFYHYQYRVYPKISNPLVYLAHQVGEGVMVYRKAKNKFKYGMVVGIRPGRGTYDVYFHNNKVAKDLDHPLVHTTDNRSHCPTPHPLHEQVHFRKHSGKTTYHKCKIQRVHRKQTLHYDIYYTSQQVTLHNILHHNLS